TEGNLHLAALSPDGKTLVGANTGSEVFFWDVASGKLLRRVRIPVPEHVRNEYLTVLLVTPDGKTVLAGTVRGKILRRELATGKELPPLSGHGDSYVTDMLPHPDGKTLISVGWDGLLRRWDLTTGEPLPAGDGYVVYLHAVLRPDGRLAAVADLAGRLDLWDTVSGRRLRSVRTFGPGLNRLAFSPDGKLLAAAQGDNRVTLWDTAAWRELRSIPLVKPPTPGRGAWFESLTFSPDGRSLLTSCEHDGMRLWAVATGKEVWHQAAHGRAVFSPDGATLVTSGWDETLTFRDPATGNARVTFSVKEQGRSIDDIAFSPDGQSFVTSHHDGTVRFRDPATGRETRRLQICRDVVWEVSFSPDGKWLLSACSDATVRLHEVATGQEVLHLKGHDARVYHGVFGPNGRTALTASWDLTALLWSLRPANIPTFDPDARWEDLRSEDAPAAYRAAWALLDDPERAVKLLRGKLSPIKREVAPDTVEKLIADLGSANFRTRARAVKDLAELGHAAAPLLRDALPKAKSAEQRERIEGLLARLRREPGPDEWRVMRAVQVLELCGTPEARQLLREWAGGTPGELLTEEAKAALARLK
ncbi:MAG TPA: hypothetical protein VIL46_17160, partial [Gemmataceae bacterium]